jgi:hypothetical protein
MEVLLQHAVGVQEHSRGEKAALEGTAPEPSAYDAGFHPGLPLRIKNYGDIETFHPIRKRLWQLGQIRTTSAFRSVFPILKET